LNYITDEKSVHFVGSSYITSCMSIPKPQAQSFIHNLVFSRIDVSVVGTT